jgi:Ca2+-binding RTX toxin-like protein
MPTLDLSKAKTEFYMTDPKLVSFGSTSSADPTTWAYLTTGGHRVLVKGSGMTFDAAGRPTAGTATSIEIDVGNDGAVDVFITGISVAAETLDDNPESFWRCLDGNDVILAPELAQVAPFSEFGMVGDGIAARAGDTSGGLDIISLGDAHAYAIGDVLEVGSRTPGGPTSVFRGGNDEILGLVTDEHHGVTGDAGRVYSGSRLEGGNDNILIQSKHLLADAEGDAGDVVGTVIGGNDYIQAGKDFQGRLTGDVRGAHPGSRVEGGDDTINAGDLGEYIVGDVYKLRGGQLVGGDDTINGGGGNDIIAGDAYEVRSDSIVTGGDDLIRAGGGNDEVYGDAGYVGQGGNDTLYGEISNDRLHGEGGDDVLDGGTQSDVLYGGDGNDTLYGGADNDTLHGDAGNDQLDGGSGADLLGGLTGNDTYFVNDAGDVVYELAGFGTDTVWSTLPTTSLGANVENLRFNGVGNFHGLGNEFDNTITGGARSDRLEGGAGNDVLDGGGEGDLLYGGAGNDIYYLDDFYDNAVEDPAQGANGVDTVLSSFIETRLGAGLENLTLLGGANASGYGNELANVITGNSGSNHINGGAGDDTVRGGAGADELVANEGEDRLIGGDGTDELRGDSGKDILRGGAGADVLIGGSGDDVFDFETAMESAPGARDACRAGEDPAAFEGIGVAGGDRIDLSGIDANTNAGGNQAFVFGGTAIGRVSAVESGGSTLIRCNTDGDAVFEFEVLIEDGGVLASAYHAGDFVL